MIDSRVLLGLLLFGLWSPGVVLAQSTPAKAPMYRYKDEQGHTVLSRQGVPTNLLKNGYDVLDDRGRVIKVVPHAPSPEEQQRQQNQTDRALADKQLLEKYTAVGELDEAQERRLAELQGHIGVAVRSLESLQRQQESDLAKAAEFERSGMVVPDDLKRDLDNIKQERNSLNEQVDRQRSLIDAQTAQYEEDRPRLIQLLNGSN